jgi:hypothetical protein
MAIGSVCLAALVAHAEPVHASSTFIARIVTPAIYKLIPPEQDPHCPPSLTDGGRFFPRITAAE